MVDFRELVKAGVHFGHQKSRGCPKMAPYIWGVKNKVHLIDVSKTAHHLENAAKFLESVASEGKTIMWVGTKKPAQKTIEAIAKKLDMPYVNYRWIGGTLSNFAQVKKSVTKLLHYEDILARSEKFPHYTKKELNSFQKVANRLNECIGGIRNLSFPMGAVVLVDVARESSALKEAVKMGIPVVAIVDTNSDPSLVDYVIPANDDSERSIELLLNNLLTAVEKGRDSAAKKAKEAKAKKEEKAAADKDKKTAKKEDTKKAAPKEVKAAPKKADAKASAKVAKPVEKKVSDEKKAPEASAEKSKSKK